MKRILGLLASVSLFLVIGCARDYDIRLDKTDRQTCAIRSGSIVIWKSPRRRSRTWRRPTSMSAPLWASKGRPRRSDWPRSSPEKFDITTSFIGDPASLHLLARVEKPKAAPKKKGANATAPPPTSAAISPPTCSTTIKSAYGVDIAVGQAQARVQGPRRKDEQLQDLDAGPDGQGSSRFIIIGEKNSPAQVALIFEYPKDQLNEPHLEDRPLPGVVPSRARVPDASTPVRTKRAARGAGAGPRRHPASSNRVMLGALIR